MRRIIEIKDIEEIINLFEYNLRRRNYKFNLSPRLIRSVIKLSREAKKAKGNLLSPYIHLTKAAKALAEKEGYSYLFVYRKLRKSMIATGEYIQKGSSLFLERKKVASLFSKFHEIPKRLETIEDLEEEDFLQGVFNVLQAKKLPATRSRLLIDYGLTEQQVAKYNYLYKRV